MIAKFCLTGLTLEQSYKKKTKFWSVGVEYNKQQRPEYILSQTEEKILIWFGFHYALALYIFVVREHQQLLFGNMKNEVNEFMSFDEN